MRKLLNTLFVQTEDAYLRLDNENVSIVVDDNVKKRFPLANLENIVSFGYGGASAALMGACAERNIGLAFCKPSGKFLARIAGESKGNVLLRREQYRRADDEARSCLIARHFIIGKIHNARQNIARTQRDNKMRIDDVKFQNAADTLQGILANVVQETRLDDLRGWEGAAAKVYFSVFDDMILRNKDDFFLNDRNRRPPLDNVNAMLSFAYTMLSHDCASALESVGLDSYVGFLHRDRSGRRSLALDLMEELRPHIADRFVLTLINRGEVNGDDFVQSESGDVRMTDDARKRFCKSWQERKVKETINHPYLNEKIPWGLVPYVQAMLLARHLRGDLDAYPPFLWK
ncbi:MAG: type I-C CRISPR-associated endonuclease Cas1c [Peptococcaceae bacterium]|nr:type I-C CRISPR-associated endonuclease Cas1c [Peptococcaceae bacterium]